MVHRSNIDRSPGDLGEEMSRFGTGLLSRRDVNQKRNGRRISPQTVAAVLILIDILAIVGSALLNFSDGVDARLIAVRPAVVLALVIPLYLFVAFLAAVYDERRIFDARHGLRRTAISLVVTFASTTLLALAARKMTLQSVETLFCWATSTLIVITAMKCLFLRRIAAAFRSGHFYVVRVLSIGVACDPIDAAEIARRSRKQARAIHAIRVEDPVELNDVSDIVTRWEIDRIYVTSALAATSQIAERLRFLQRVTWESLVAPNERRISSADRGGADAPDYVAVTIIDVAFDHWRLWSKRAQDVVIAGMVLTLAAPLLIILAAAIRIESRGPVLSRRRWTSKGRAPYELWTFRVKDADGRETRAGRFMRRTSFERLPLFANVLQGRLSIVGPRPYGTDGVPRDDALSELSTRYAASHRVNPGLTGLAQVAGLRGDLECAMNVGRRVALDWAYIEKRSTWLDLTIMLRTISIVVRDCIADHCPAP